jgi:Rps23 Pro-64 3,4-dihydroxylase Tpa1-like proline 4-hydroxylase
LIRSAGQHQAKKVFESPQAIVFDNFLPENMFHKLHDDMLKVDYERINVSGKFNLTHQLQNGSPLRSVKHVFYHSDNATKPQGPDIYPSGSFMDAFIEHMLAVKPHIEHVVGKEGEAWDVVSVKSCLYPPGTGLALHSDAAPNFSGGYDYCLNPQWKPHWGGMLLLVDGDARRAIIESGGGMRSVDELVIEHGFAQTIFPKKNRAVFIAKGAYHMITRVNEQAGDHARMSLTGFFQRKINRI